jgi:hypothetical protein
MPVLIAGTRLEMDFFIMIITENCNIVGPKFREHLKKKCSYFNKSGNQRQSTKKENGKSGLKVLRYG